MESLSEAEELKVLILQVMETLVPGEDYSIDISEVNGHYKFELNTESKRAMVAWAEISFVLEEGIDRDQDESLGFDEVDFGP